MSAVYPSAIKTFNRRRDLLDIIQAVDINQTYDEITALQTTLGTFINSKPAAWSSGSFTTPSSWPTFRERIENIEAGVFVAFNDRVRTSGGSTVTVTDNATVSLTIRAKSGQTADLLQLQNSSGTVVTRITSDGNLSLGGIAPVTLTGTQTITNKTISGAQNTLLNISPSSVIVSGTTNIQQFVEARPTVLYQGTAPTGVIVGTIWVNSAQNIDPFDTSALLLTTAPSPAPTEFGYRRIIAATTAPQSSDGANGDVWLQYV
jgi:hypothetical protein